MNPIIILPALIVLWMILRFFIKSSLGMQLPQGNGDYQAIPVQKAKELIEENQNNNEFILLDVRSVNEFTKGHLDRAINIDINSYQFTADIQKLNRNAIILIYCLTGARSANAMHVMANLGFKTLYNMQGGIAAWNRNGFPVV